ncbi:MAG: histidine phosphatase family protein [Clostridia bacterium]|nr:histidine phosphatase family protein [Clostridia bacterium]
MLIFFVRHGLTDWNIQRRFQGTLDIPLNDAGLLQAKSAAKRCSELHLERIYHSTLLRAAQTAQAIADASGAPLYPCKGFNEVCLGVFQGLNHEEAKARYPEDYAHYFADRINGAPPEGESLYQVQQRALEALSFVERDATGCERIAIVSHGALLKALLGALAGIPLENYTCYDVSNGSISVIESKDGARRLITLNAMAHFGDPYADMAKTKLLI